MGEYTVEDYVDIPIILNSNADVAWYKGTDGDCSDDQVDLATVIAHEFAHGLGFASYLNSDGSWATWDDDGTDRVSIFDKYLYYNGSRVTNLSQSQRRAAIRSGSLYWDGANATSANGGTRVELYAPSSWEEGSSVSHWDDDSRPLGAQTFMYAYYIGPVHGVDRKMIGVMQDIGWGLEASSSTSPSTTSNVQASDGSYADKVRVTWSKASGATSYRVYRGTTSSSASALLASGIISPYYNDTSASLGQTYYYWVRAVNSVGMSGYGSYDTGYRAQSVTVPSAPTNVQASDGTYTDKVYISWGSVSGATSYKVYRYTSNSSSSANVLASSVSGTYYNDTSAVAGTTYYYWVKAVNSAGSSGFSSSNTGYRAVPVTTPSAPTNVSASDGTYTDKVYISWGSVSGATSYTVYRGTSSSSSSASVLASSVTSTYYNDTSAVAGTTYYYWVKAVNSAGTSGFSSYNSGYRAIVVPSAPSGVSASDGAYMDKVRIMWSAVSDAISYTVARRPVGGNSSEDVFYRGITTTYYDDTTAIAGINYYYWVLAVNNAGSSDWSDLDRGYRAEVDSSINWEYMIEGSGVTITNLCTNTVGRVIIPNTINGKTVLKIGSGTFSDCDKIESLIIPSSVTNIASPSKLSSCLSLESIEVFPGNLYYSSVDGVLFNKNKTELLAYPSGCEGDYSIPQGVKKIPEGAFSDSSKPETLTIPESIEVIEHSALYKVFGLKPFHSSFLRTINVSENNQNYSSVDGVLFNKDKTNLICCPENRRGTFSIPNGTLTIEGPAFVQCAYLEALEIPASLSSISAPLVGSFMGCTSLVEFNVVPGNSNFFSQDGVLFENDDYSQVTLFRYPPAKIGMYSIPNGVTDIGMASFHFCEGLTSIIVPPSVTNISAGIGATHGFSSCKNLQTAYVPINPSFDVASLKIPESTELIYYNPDIGPQPSYTASSFNGTFNGNYRGITVSVSQPTSGYTIQYATSSSGPWSSTKPTYRNVCSGVKTYFKITASGYADVIDYKTVTITAKTLTSSMVSLSATSFVYDGAAKEPSVSFTDANVTSSDYTISYANNVNPGTATVTITGKGNYTGTVTKTFTIIKANNSWTTEPSIANWTYGDTASTPVAAAQYGTCTVTYNGSSVKPTNAGTYTATFTVPASSTYGVLSRDVQFTILPRTLTDSMVSLSATSFVFDGTAKEPEVNVADNGLITRDDYEISYANNINPGTATVTIMGKGNYTGTVTKTFTIEEAAVTHPDVTVDGIHWTGSGEAAWTIDSTSPFAATSGDVDDGQSTSLTATFSGMGILSFKWKVSSESYFDKLIFYTDGEVHSEISGTDEDWSTVAIAMNTADEHSFKWTYSKDGSGNCGSDCGWIKDVTWTICEFPNEWEFQIFDDGVRIERFVNKNVVGEVEIPNAICGYPVSGIGAYAFHECRGITSVKIPDGVRFIVDYAFYECSGLENIVIPDSVTYIGPYAFEDCSSVGDIVIGNGLRSLMNYYYWVGWCEVSPIFDFSSVTNLVIGKGVRQLEDDLLSGCEHLENVVIGAGVTNIGARAFSGTGLVNIIIPDSVECVGEGVFNDCSSLETISIPFHLSEYAEALQEGNTATIQIRDEAEPVETDFLYEKTDAGIMITGYNSDVPGELVIPSEIGGVAVVGIGESAFEDGLSLVSVTIPDSVTTIGVRAFCWCENLTQVTLGNGVTSLGNYAFRACGLTTIDIPDSVTTVGSKVFQGCDLLETIYVSADFSEANCTSLQDGNDATIVRRAGVDPNIVFETTADGLVVVGYNGMVPDSLVVPARKDGIAVVGIKASAFEDCDTLVSVTIPDSVTTIGDGAFYWCVSLEQVSFGKGLTTIGNNAFRACEALKTMTIPASVTSIGTRVFQGCDALTDIYITEQQSGFADALTYGNNAVVHIGSGTSTTGGVPHDWIDDYKGDPAFAAAVAAAGGDYEKLAQIKGLNGYTFEECYVIGIKPTEKDGKFVSKIEIVDGVPVITPDPDLGTDRRYVTEGVSELGGEWTEIKSDADKADKRFFRVKVALPK